MNYKRHESWVDLTAAADWWRKLAADEMRARDPGLQTDKGIAEYRAWIYEKIAKAIDIERETGVAVCPYSHMPLSGKPR